MHRARVSLIAICLLAASPANAGTVPSFLWAVQPQLPTGNTSAYGVVFDHSGNSVVCGQFTDTLTLSTGTIRATGNTIPNNTDVFVAKYDAFGVALWARNGGNSSLGSNEVGYDVAVDPAGNVYVTGEYSGSSPTSFGSVEIDNTGGGAFAVKYDPSGTVLWATSVSTSGVGYSIATSGSSLAYVFVGGFPGSSVKKLDAANGNEIDSWNFSGLILDPAMEISVDGSGNVVISGGFTGTVDFDPGGGTSNLTGDANGDGFIVKYTSTGTVLWARKLSSTGADGVLSHTLAASGDVYFSGVAEAAPTIDVVSANGGQVVGRLDPNGGGQWMRNATSQFFGGDLDVAADRIGVDGDGNYYIIGNGQNGAGDIGTFTIPFVNHFHVVRYSPAGAVSYAKFVTTGTSLAFPRAIAVFGPDLFNVVGGIVAETVFDAITLPDINGSPRMNSFAAQVGDVTLPALASLAIAEAAPDRVRLTWYVTDLMGAAFVERRRGDDEWVVLGEASRRGPDYVVYEDRDVAPGERLTYRLQWTEGGEALHSDPVSITVPRLIERLALAAAPNPASGFLDALISVPGSGEALLAMHDILGRQVAERRVEANAAGRLTVRIGTSELPAGLYWLSLRHDGEVARARVSVVR